MKPLRSMLLLAPSLLLAGAAGAQGTPSSDRILNAIWEEGMSRSQIERLAQPLLDSIGPRLTGSPQQKAANDWAVAQYRSWGIPARNERYGSWRGWDRGVTQVDLLSPRVRSLEGIALAWSPGTGGAAVEGAVALLPEVADSAAFARWLPEARGRWILVSPPMPTCRPLENWERWGGEESRATAQARIQEVQRSWAARLRNSGETAATLPKRLEAAGALGLVSSNWSGGWGVNKIFLARTQRTPTVDLSCEDYGLVARLSSNGQAPRLRIRADSRELGEVPVYNTIAEIRGRQRPSEYVILSAHFDSWDGASGATDNGTGTLVMMEAMRILKAVYPSPRRTILAGHWSGEEQGLNGSRAFVADNPRIVAGIQALFNQDNGTGPIRSISMQGFTGAGERFRSWLARAPEELTREIRVVSPGTPGAGGSDHASFVCAGAPAFMLGSESWDYGTYTWHTNLDTYDKIAFDQVRRNAVLTAMLAYMAAEDPERLPRERLTEFAGRGGETLSWPACRPAARSWAESGY